MDERSLFLAALDKPTAERAAFLHEACPDDVLCHQVEALLQAHDRAQGFLDQPAAGTGEFIPNPKPNSFAAPEPSESPGLWIGPYKLLQQIGEGGMGTVWMAEQEHPVRRRVALKVIKPGMDSAQVIARFEAERQALALMDHQNIAKVLDVGTAPGGRPYFVMELIKGVPITKFCDEHHLTPKERLELFVPVCQAVQHAHQKGVIHRDLKPSNVLVTLYDGRPVPKVIDFGVAKALHQKLTERTLFTDFGAVVGTLEYMAPEQAALSHLDVDTRSDVYSLGVLLYELLTGTTPFERKRLRQAAFDEVLRIIREEEPPKPSTRLSESGDSLPSIAAARKTEPAKLSRLVRGELDWIVMRALEKDRARRYETANGFARDIQNYLADEPVEACPPSAGYKLRKFARKHRRWLATAAAFVLLLATAAAVSAALAVWALRAERAAVAARDDEAAQRAEAERQRNEAQAARTLADRNFQKARAAVESYLEKVADNPDLKNNPNSHELRKQLLAAAIPFFEEFVREKSDNPAIRFDQGKAYYRLALVRAAMGDHQAALRDYTTAREIHARLAADCPAVPDYRQDLALSHHSLGFLLASLGQRSAAEAEYRAALALREKLAADFPAVADYRRDLANSHHNLGVLLVRLGQRSAAAAEYRTTLALQEKLAAEFPAVPQYRQDLALSHHNLGLLLRDLGQRSAAEAAYRRAIELREKLAADFPAVPQYRQDLARIHNSLGNLLAGLGRRPEAEAEYRAALARQEKLAADFPAVPDYRWDLANSHDNVGNLLAGQGQRSAAEAEYRAGLALKEKLAADFPAVPDYRRDLARNHNSLGNLLAGQGQRSAAEAEYRAALALQEKLAADFPAVPEYREDLATSHDNLGNLLAGQGQRSAAEGEYRAGVALREKLAADFPAVPEYRRDLARTHYSFAGLLRNLGQRPEAEGEYRAALALQEKLAANFPAVPAYRAALADTHNELGLMLENLSRRPEAEAEYRAALALQEKFAADFPAVPAYRVALAGIYVNFGILLHDGGESTAALDWYAKAIPLLEAALAENARIANARQFLRNAHWQQAQALAQLTRYAEALNDWDRALALTDGSVPATLRLGMALTVAHLGDDRKAAAEAEELTRGDKVPVSTLYDAARVYALSSAAAKNDAQRQESYAARAVELLRQAVLKGFTDIAHMLKDSDLDPLRRRDDYAAMLWDLAGTSPGGRPSP